MNAQIMAQRAYAPTAAPTRSGRSVEYDVISRITFRLKSAIEKNHFPSLLESLHENRKLWRVLAINVADDDNELPKELRARLLYLSEFTNKHTSEVIARKASPIVLLEVNTAILRGLKERETST